MKFKICYKATGVGCRRGRLFIPTPNHVLVGSCICLVCSNWKFLYKKIVAAFRGMQVSPAKHSFVKCDRKVWQTDRQTDGRTDRQTDRQTTDKVIPMCRYASQATQKLPVPLNDLIATLFSSRVSSSKLPFEIKMIYWHRMWVKYFLWYKYLMSFIFLCGINFESGKL